MATKTAIILHQEGHVTEVEYDEKTQLRTLQQAVGGFIESVEFLFGLQAYANEEGLYTPGLRVNWHAATVLNTVIMGNIVIPSVTPTKRARLTAKGFSL